MSNMSKEFCRLYLTSTSGVCLSLSPQTPLVFPQKRLHLQKRLHIGHCMLRTALHSQQQPNNNNNNKIAHRKCEKTRPAGEAQGQGVTVMASRVERGVLAFATS